MVEGIAAVATGVGLLLGFMAVGLPVFAAFLLVMSLATPVDGTDSNELAEERELVLIATTVAENYYRQGYHQRIDLAKSDGVIPVLILYPSPQFRTTSREIKEFANHEIIEKDMKSTSICFEYRYHIILQK